MTPNAPHTMALESTRPGGLEMWLCPACGRRLLMRLWPVFFKHTIVEGDSSVRHSGSRGGLGLGNVTAKGDVHADS